jgi:hypothetical protein
VFHTHISPGGRKTGPLVAAVQRQAHPIVVVVVIIIINPTMNLYESGYVKLNFQ